MDGKSKGDNLHVVCFNCGQIGHLHSSCNRPKVCFICYSSKHVVDLCPEWKKPAKSAQYFGSANKGLGFYYIDVEDSEDRFKHWVRLDNFGVITIEKGEIDEEDRKVENLVIGEASVFYLNRPSVVGSLSVWNGEIEPTGSLTEVWVLIQGIPPKWVDWKTMSEVALGLGRLIEVDWQALFNSFFSTVRAKVLCKDPTKIPKERLFVFKDKIHLIMFTLEGYEQVDNNTDGGSNKGGGAEKKGEEHLEDDIPHPENGDDNGPSDDDKDKEQTQFATKSQGSKSAPVGSRNVKRAL
ncbi:unnamed protein product [Miscanthus lutarioriparius]|uniref:CCHC-type domain-containing protein n=1 Tax=Miscanthus lutarioriparius TaxID=422564 RepID=A0A811PDY7_9POAL|nr:unnamed protein product [Miscanthus lutarioriparius]